MDKERYLMIIYHFYDSRGKKAENVYIFRLHRYRHNTRTKKNIYCTCVWPLMLPVVWSVTAACNSFGWVPLFRTDCTSQIAWSKCLHFQNATRDSECKNLGVYTQILRYYYTYYMWLCFVVLWYTFYLSCISRGALQQKVDIKVLQCQVTKQIPKVIATNFIIQKFPKFRDVPSWCLYELSSILAIKDLHSVQLENQLPNGVKPPDPTVETSPPEVITSPALKPRSPRTPPWTKTWSVATGAKQTWAMRAKRHERRWNICARCRRATWCFHGGLSKQKNGEGCHIVSLEIWDMSWISLLGLPTTKC